MVGVTPRTKLMPAIVARDPLACRNQVLVQGMVELYKRMVADAVDEHDPSIRAFEKTVLESDGTRDEVGHVVLLPPKCVVHTPDRTVSLAQALEMVRDKSDDKVAYVMLGTHPLRLARATRRTWDAVWRALPTDARVKVGIHGEHTDQVHVTTGKLSEVPGGYFRSVRELRGMVEQ